MYLLWVESLRSIVKIWKFDIEHNLFEYGNISRHVSELSRTLRTTAERLWRGINKPQNAIPGVNGKFLIRLKMYWIQPTSLQSKIITWILNFEHLKTKNNHQIFGKLQIWYYFLSKNSSNHLKIIVNNHPPNNIRFQLFANLHILIKKHKLWKNSLMRASFETEPKDLPHSNAIKQKEYVNNETRLNPRAKHS